MAVRFDAATDFLRRTASVHSGTTFSVSMWFRNIGSVAVFPTFFANDDDPGVAYFLFGLTSTPVIDVAASTGGPVTGTTTVNSNQWYHTAVIKNGLNCTIFLDGIQEATAADLGNVSNARLWIGNDKFDEPFDGRVAAVKIWEAALTADELRQERWSYAPRRTANLWACYSMIDLAPGNFGLDMSGNGRDLTANGTLTYEDGPPITWGFGGDSDGRELFVPPPPASTVVPGRRLYAFR